MLLTVMNFSGSFTGVRYIMNRLLSILSIWVFTATVAAAEPDLLFQSTDLLNMTLTAPFTIIDRERDKEKEPSQ